MFNTSGNDYRNGLQAAIFDWAGTTVDYGCFAPAVAFQRAFEKYGISLPMQEIRRPMGLNKRDHIKSILTHFGITDISIEKIYTAFILELTKTIREFSGIIPGVKDVIDVMRDRNMKIGSTTGYSIDMMDILRVEAAKQGYIPDSAVSSSEVPSGRPAPWMVYMNAMNLQTYPMETFVKIGDTIPDIQEGLNAGMWTIGVITTGNEMALSQREVISAPRDELQTKQQVIRNRFFEAGAHYAVDYPDEIPALLDEIDLRLAMGERPVKQSKTELFA
jgi:phosphonoacetaldehyde hydrolase